MPGCLPLGRTSVVDVAYITSFPRVNQGLNLGYSCLGVQANRCKMLTDTVSWIEYSQVQKPGLARKSTKHVCPSLRERSHRNNGRRSSLRSLGGLMRTPLLGPLVDKYWHSVNRVRHGVDQNNHSNGAAPTAASARISLPR